MTLFQRVVSMIVAFIPAFSFQAFADGTHPEETAGTPAGTYVIIAFAVLFAVFAAAFGLRKKRSRGRPGAGVSALKWGWILSLLGLVLAIGVNFAGKQNQNEQIFMEHIHGLGYSQNGDRLLFAAHDGIRVLSQGHWSIGHGAKHDYMGFSPVDQGFYSSGHPEPGSKWQEPFGVVRSRDDGLTLEPLAFYGQIDFHIMTAGYRSHTLYVYNPQSQPGLNEAGLYFSRDDGITWSKSDAKGLAGDWTAVAAHPDEASVVAVGTTNGLFISRDYGESFVSLLGSKQVTALVFSPQGLLYAGTYDQEPDFVAIKPDSKEVKQLSLPPLAKDAVAYIAIHPGNERELSIATFNKHAFTSPDVGSTWKQIVFEGRTDPE